MTRIPASDDLGELHRLLRRVLRGTWSRRRPTPELLELVGGDPPLGRRHVGVLAHVAAEGERTVGEIARELGLSLPAASKLVGELEDHSLVSRHEDPGDRRRTVVRLDPETSKRVLGWLGRRNQPLEAALATLTADERAGFLKGMRALADALMEESSRGPLGCHHRTTHRRRPNRDRPV
ncbi:MAG: helix-turn-helix domain-containing protein [Gaiellaceae bacterium]